MNAAADAALDETAESLLPRLRRGDSFAFEQLVRQNTGRLLVVARRLLRNEVDAQDAVQDAFLSAYRALPDFDGRSALYTWLHRIVVNACLMKLRKRRPETSIDSLLPKFAPDGHHADPVDPWAEPAEAILARREACTLVRSAINQLPETHRTILILRDIEGVNTAEAAAMLGVTEGVAKIRLHRARLALRGLLDGHFGGGAA